MDNLYEHPLAAVIEKRMPGFLSYLVEDLGVTEFTNINLSNADNNRFLFANALNDNELIMQSGILNQVEDAEDPTTFAGALLRDKNWTFSNYSQAQGNALLSNRNRAKGFHGGDQRGDPSALNDFAKAVFDPMNVMRAVGALSSKWTVHNDSYSGDNRKSHAYAYFDDNAEVINILTAIVTTHGYELEPAYPLVAGPHAGSRRVYEVDPRVKLSWPTGYSGTAMGGSAGPGVKYMPIIVTAVKTQTAATLLGLNEYWHDGITGALGLIPHSDQHGLITVLVPVKDDGLASVVGVSVLARSHYGSGASPILINNDTDVQSTRYNYFSVPDYRYGGGSSSGLTYDYGVVSAFQPRIRDIDGKPFNLSAITGSNWGQSSSAVVSQQQAKMLWPLLVPMGSVGCIYQGTHVYVGATDIEYPTRSGGVRTLKLHTYNLNVQRMGLQFSREWYRNYYTRGFGVYTPRASKEREKVMKEWDELEWENFYVFRSDVSYEFSTADIRGLDIYRDYGISRDKACKTNNFLELPFDSKRTWKQAGERLEAFGPMNTFYAVRSGQAVSFSLSENIAKLGKYRVVGPIVDNQYKIIDDLGKTTLHVVGNEPSLEQVVSINSAGGSFEGITLEELLDDDTRSEMSAMAAELENLKKVVDFSNDKRLDGYHPTVSYGSTWTQLTKSGYPVVDQLTSRERTYCALNSVLTLQTMGSRIMKVYNDITTESILAKA